MEPVLSFGAILTISILGGCARIYHVRRHYDEVRAAIAQEEQRRSHRARPVPLGRSDPVPIPGAERRHGTADAPRVY